MRNACSAGFITGAPAACPSVTATVRPSSSRSAGMWRSGGARTRRLGDLQRPAAGRQAAGGQRRAECVAVGLARQPGIERLEPSGGLDQEQVRVAAIAGVDRQLGAQQLPPGRARAHPAARPAPWPAAAAPLAAHRPGTWRAPRPAPAAPGGPGPASARRRARRRQPPLPGHRVRAPGRPSPPAQPRHPHPVPVPRARGARRGDRDRRRGRWRPQAPGGRAGAAPARPPSRPRPGRADGRTARARRTRGARPRSPPPRPRPRRRAARPPARAAPDPRSAPPRRPPAAAASARAGPRTASRKPSSIRPGVVPPRPAARNRRPAPRAQPARPLQQRPRVASRLGHDSVTHPFVRADR